MPLMHWVVTTTIKGSMSLLCRIDDSQLSRIPAAGPLILVTNHVNFLDAPVMYTSLQPRPMTAFAKIESWDSPWMGRLFDLWKVIPIHRGAADITAMRKGLQALQQGKILAISPEGTRSGNGRLLPGHPGMIPVALHSGAPLLPVVFYGHDRFRNDFRNLRRTEFHISVGEPFYLELPVKKLTHEMRQEITDEIMFRLAELLPVEYRGTYANLTGASSNYLRFALNESIGATPQSSRIAPMV